MKKKLIISLFSVFVLAIATMGTVAYFTKSFQSDQNIAKAAVFNVDVVDSSEKTIGNSQFDLNEKLFPGMDPVEVYSFQIKKNDTEVPVEYKVNLTPSGDLFPQDNRSPVKMTLKRNVNNDWVEVEYSTNFKPENATESYKIFVSWPHSDHDIDFQGKTGNIKLEVTATQVDKEVPIDNTTYEVASNALAALDNVGTGFNKGNFSKAQSDEVQTLINNLMTYVNGLPNGNGKTELLDKANKLQNDLNAKVASRYVYYEVEKGATNFDQLKLKLTTSFFQADSPRTQNGNAVYLNSGGEDKMVYLRYLIYSWSKPTAGDVVTFTMRFNGGYKNINATFTNVGDGTWKIQSDWLVEKK
ncbi:hypothetical protein ACFSO7_02510 [Bacillus sp. CGMCC 1.16607]|uniref:hypothetical protein n=1 Tax=Bacillus sp. CGMCC 1.16607 TaxID=3351842 RepID=UPI003637D027